MAIAVVATKNSLATSYAGLALYAALASTAPGATAGTELTGGSPAYARRAITWGTAASGAVTGTIATPFDVPSGATVAGVMYFTAATGGSYVDGFTVTSQAFATQGQYNISPMTETIS